MESTTTKELFERGKHYFEGKNYERAEQCFLKILRGGARYADVLNLLGVIYHVEGKFNDAIASFEEALTVNPNYTEATLNLAVLFNDLGEYKKAKDLYGRVRKRTSSSRLDPILRGKIANSHAHLGDTYRNITQYEDAIEEYKKALKICPTFADIRTKLGIAYRENRQNALSIKELLQIIKQEPAFRQAQIQLGVTYFTAGQKEKAAQAWREVLKEDKDNELARIYLRLCEDGAKK
jgi:tetratricopeptide (TPR) repeat protein